MAGGVLACVCCPLMTAYDKARFHDVHQALLLLTFLGIGISAVGTSAVYLDMATGNLENTVGRQRGRGKLGR